MWWQSRTSSASAPRKIVFTSWNAPQNGSQNQPLVSS